MSSLMFIRDDIVALTHCKFKGHTVSSHVLDMLEKERHVVDRCEKCHYPISVEIDPDNPEYYLAREVE